MQMAQSVLATGWLPEYRVAETLRMRAEISAYDLDLEKVAMAEPAEEE